MIKPIGENILVEVTIKEEKTASGIYLPSTAEKEKPQTGRVVAIGKRVGFTKAMVLPPDIKVGNEVIFAKYSGTDIKVDGKDYLIIKESDILAVIEEV